MNLIEANILTSLVTAGMCLSVMLYWRPNFSRVLSGKGVPTDWLVCGVWISFLGSLLDNTLWVACWRAKALHLSTEEWWFSIGPAGNVLFRHATKCLACLCHLVAIAKSGESSASVLNSAIFAWLMAIVVYFIIM